jgi:alanine dehydrogenase
MYIVGVPQEMKKGEYRVGLTPEAVQRLITNCKCRILVESGAGRASGFEDEEYAQAGAEIVDWDLKHKYLGAANLIVKVKEPLPEELNMLLSPKKSVAGFFHFSANPKLKMFFEENNVPYFDFGQVMNKEGFRPILAAMSEIAGERAILEGFHYLNKPLGLGIMPSDARITIVGAGVAGMAGAEMARGLYVKEINIFDTNIDKLISSRFPIRRASAEKIAAILPKTDLLISAVAIKGGQAPKVFTRKMITSMSAGSVFVDISIDEGGSAETSWPTNYLNPTYTENGVIHYCVPNIPGQVPRTASPALSQAALPYLIKFIERLAVKLK